MGSNIEWALGSTTGLDPDILYPVRGDRWAPPQPVACPNGHPLAPGRTIVGTIACITTAGQICHRTYTCRTCDAVIMWPPETDDCQHRPFDGR